MGRQVGDDLTQYLQRIAQECKPVALKVGLISVRVVFVLNETLLDRLQAKGDLTIEQTL